MTLPFWTILAEQNPWHSTGAVPGSFGPPVLRPLALNLWRRLLKDEPRRFQVILGPRRVGKTTALYQTVARLLEEGIEAKRLWWIRLDHPVLMELSLGTLVREIVQLTRATAERPVWLFLDELVYSNQWDLWLKTFYDEQWPIRVAASSSSTAALRARRQESGVGRWDEQFLAPYLFDEYLDLIDDSASFHAEPTLAETLDSIIVRAEAWPSNLTDHRRRFMMAGGFPELLLSTRNRSLDDASIVLESQRTLRNDAIERAVYKDIPQAFNIGSPLQLERLLYTLAGQVSSIVSPNAIGRSLAMSGATIDRYITYLERAFLITLLPNFAGSEETVQRRGRKLYFVDGAVRNAALQRGIAFLDDPAEHGLLIENLAATHLLALSYHTHARLHHWRREQDEVDFVYAHPTQPIAIEVSASSRHHRRGLHAIARSHPELTDRRYVVAPNLLAIHPSMSPDGIGTLPLDLFLLAVGYQTRRALIERLAVYR